MDTEQFQKTDKTGRFPVNQYKIFDNHFHLNYHSDFLKGVMKFKKAGGEAINLTCLPDYSMPPSGYYERIYEETIKMADRVREELNVTVLVTLGPYPLDLLHFRESVEDSFKMVQDGMDLASKFISEGKANAMGEIGRPHFEVPLPDLERSDRLLEYAFNLCNDLKCPAILHTEDLDEQRILNIEKMALKSGLNPGKVVKHHALVENLGSRSPMIFSLPATRKNVRTAMEMKKKFLLETDYINDPKDDNRFLPPDSVPLRARMIRQSYPDQWEEIFENIFRNIPIKLFGEESFKTLQ